MERAQVANNVSAFFKSESIDSFVEMYDDAAVYMGPDVEKPIYGKQRIGQQFQSYFVAFPDMKTEHRVLSESPTQLIISGVTRGTHTGRLETPWGTVEPTNRHVLFEYVGVYQLDTYGRIVDDRTYFDYAGVLNQLGVLTIEK